MTGTLLSPQYHGTQIESSVRKQRPKQSIQVTFADSASQWLQAQDMAAPRGAAVVTAGLIARSKQITDDGGPTRAVKGADYNR